MRKKPLKTPKWVISTSKSKSEKQYDGKTKTAHNLKD